MASKDNEKGDGEAQRNNSLTSLGSLKGLVSTMKKVARSDSKKSDSSVERQEPLDNLPDTRVGLEARLNYHLSELDHIRRSVVARNQEIRDFSSRAAYQHRLRSDVPASIRKLDEAINTLRVQRNGFLPFVEYHQNEVRRITQRRKELDDSQGLECIVLQMYTGFLREAEWLQLFSV